MPNICGKIKMDGFTVIVTNPVPWLHWKISRGGFNENSEVFGYFTAILVKKEYGFTEIFRTRYHHLGKLNMIERRER
jgi:hypothetical protein